MLPKVIPDSVQDWLNQYQWSEDFNALTWQHKVTLITSGVCGLSVGCYLWKRYQDRNLPPGPTGWPIVGCRGLMEGDHYQSDLAELGRKYGDVFSLQNGTNRVIILNSYSAIKEAFVEQKEVFACRPNANNTLLAMQLQDDLFSSPYETPGWNENRAVVVSCLRSAGFGSSRAIESKVLEQVQELGSFLDVFAKQGKPVDFTEVIPKATINVIFQVVMSRQFDYDDPQLDEVLRIAQNWLAAFDGVIFDALPTWFVKLFCFNQVASKFKMAEELRDLIRPEVTQHVATLNPDDPRDFIDSYLIKNEGKRPLSKLIDNILMLLPDACDTLSLTMAWVFLYITYYQDVQDKIAEEIATLTGGNRYVTWSDKKNLPYTEAVVTEVLRIEPPLTTSLAHCTSEEVIFRGFRIPPRATVFAHFHAAHRDPALFADPDVFKPERFLTSEDRVTLADTWMPFGLGRRKCVGESIARMELFLFTANIVQKYHMTFPDGTTPTLDGMRNLFSVPPSYTVVLNNRQ